MKQKKTKWLIIGIVIGVLLIGAGVAIGVYFYNQNQTEETGKKKKEEKKPQPINTPVPLWTKHPNDCTEEEYKKFYREVFHDYKEPLFWIHLNMDYPFNLKGILYFPKLNTEYDQLEGTIKL